LTELGRDLLIPVKALTAWAQESQARVEAARSRFDEARESVDSAA
jgi:DNA-binding HxlR family transcriptional regulator